VELEREAHLPERAREEGWHTSDFIAADEEGWELAGDFIAAEEAVRAENEREAHLAQRAREERRVQLREERRHLTSDLLKLAQTAAENEALRAAVDSARRENNEHESESAAWAERAEEEFHSFSSLPRLGFDSTKPDFYKRQDISAGQDPRQPELFGVFDGGFSAAEIFDARAVFDGQRAAAVGRHAGEAFSAGGIISGGFSAAEIFDAHAGLKSAAESFIPAWANPRDFGIFGGGFSAAEILDTHADWAACGSRGPVPVTDRRAHAVSSIPEVQPPAEDEDAEAAAGLLQRLIRGRAAQDTMFAGKEALIGLIKELRRNTQVRDEVLDEANVGISSSEVQPPAEDEDAEAADQPLQQARRLRLIRGLFGTLR
jgi:hypothetical protein